MASNEDGSEAFIEDCLKEASSGSVEHQFFLGQHYLKQYNAGVKPEENGILATDWLMKASKQGHHDATEELKKCLKEEIGISAENRGAVEWCVRTSLLEKQARMAAQALFSSLNPLGQDVVSRDLFLKQVDQVASSKMEKTLLEKTAKRLKEEALTETAFIERMVNKLQGKGGMTMATLADPASTEAVTHHLTTTQKWLRMPAQLLMHLSNFSMDFASKQGTSFLRTLIPTHQVHMLLVVFIYSLLSISVLLWFLPIFCFAFALAAMLICTLQMLYNKQKMAEVQAHAELLKKYESAIDIDSVKSLYSWNSLTPYGMFFVNLFVCLVAFSMADKHWIPCSELTALSMFCAIICFFALSNEHDYLFLLSVVCNFVAALPTFVTHIPAIPVLHHVLLFFCGSAYSVEITPELHINFGLPSMVYMVVPVLFFKMAVKKSWQGTYQVLIPHLVAIFWWQLMLVFYSYASWIGLFRSFVGWIALVVCLPFLSIAALVGGLVYVIHWMTFSGFLKLVTTLLLLAIPAGLAVWSSQGYKVGNVSLTGSSKGKLLLVMISVFSVIPMMYLITPPERDVGQAYMTWEQYRKFCSKPQWDKTNMAHSQILCSNFQDMTAEWTGEITKIVVKSIDNQAEDFISKLPVTLGNWLRCTYGTEYPPCDTVENAVERELCEVSTMQDQSCHLEEMNFYTFEVWVAMEIDAENVHDIRIKARHEFKKILLNLKAGNIVTFRAALDGSLGDKWPELQLYHIECKSCMETLSPADTVDLQPEESGMTLTLRLVKQAVYDAMNFFTSPVLDFGVKNKDDESTTM